MSSLTPDDAYTQVNGMDIIASKHAVEYARKWVVEGNGPLLMEFVTYRYGGHSYVPRLHVFFALSLIT